MVAAIGKGIGMKLLAPVQDLRGYPLIHAGIQVLCDVERNGMCLDVRYCQEQAALLDQRIVLLEQAMREDAVGVVWRKMHSTPNYGSGPQLAQVLFDGMNVPCLVYTESGKPSYSEAAFSHVDLPIVKLFKKLKELEKIKNTYLEGFMRETVGWTLRPSFNLHTTCTYRSSSDSPNFQNIPVRNPMIKKLLRSAIRARKGNRIVEVDYSGLEVNISACYHKDPVMIKYLTDPSSDMHKDMAAQLYCLPLEQVTKEIRTYAKGCFVFPAFYGSYWRSMAPDLWDARVCKAADGALVAVYLEQAGYGTLGDPKEATGYYGWVRSVDRDFWEKRFRVYGAWRKRIYEDYLEQGQIISHTGFTYGGYMDFRSVINYPVQGSAFHCLLWSLIHLNAEIKARGMRTLLIGQIHDSIVADVPGEEFEDYCALVHRICEVEIRKTWDWIIVPLKVEIEASGVNGSWYEKVGVE